MNRGDDEHDKRDQHIAEMARDQEHGQHDKTRLPDGADYDIEHIAEEIRVPLKAGVFFDNLGMDRSPETPGPHPAIEILEHCLLFGWVRNVPRKQPTSERTRMSGNEVMGCPSRTITWAASVPKCDSTNGWSMGNDVRHDQRQSQRGGDARHHAPEITPAVEPPPIPLEHVRSRVAAPQTRHDPLARPS